MKVRARFFARYREVVGRAEMELELAEGATVAQVLSYLRQQFPHLPSSPIMVAVNADYVQPDFVLSPGDEVAFIPPVSGGDWFQVTQEPLSPELVTDKVEGNAYGAVITFVGMVREESEGMKVLHLDYEAYPEMAEKKLRQIAAEMRQRWGVGQVAMAHRLGRVRVGEAGLVVAVSAPHRKEAFAACAYAIDRIKEIVPIWKKEVRQDGAVWVEGPESKRD